MIGVIGESLVDFIASAPEEASVWFDSHIGGCGLNTATAASLQNAPVGFIGKISIDMFGKRILEHLVSSKILFDPSLCQAEQSTLLAFASLDELKRATYAFYWKGSAGVSLSKEELLSVMREHTDLRVVHIGSLALALPPSSDAILSALNEIEPRPIIFLDPNVRPMVISDRQAFVQLMEKSIELASIVKVSDEDLAYLYPDKDVHKVAQDFATKGSKHIILTLGRQGSVWYAPDLEPISMPIIDLPVADTVGAGDTFSGSLLSYLHERELFGADGQKPQLKKLSADLIKDALRWATAASAINCTRKGCCPPTKDEIQALLATL